MTVKQWDSVHTHTHSHTISIYAHTQTYNFKDSPDDAPIKLYHMEAIECEIENRDRSTIIMSVL